MIRADVSPLKKKKKTQFIFLIYFPAVTVDKIQPDAHFTMYGKGHQWTLPVYVTCTSPSNLILAQALTQVDHSGTGSQVWLIHFLSLYYHYPNIRRNSMHKPKNVIYFKLLQ